MLRSAINTVQYVLRHPLTRTRPWQSFARIARWQISSRMASGPIAVGFVNDARLLVAPGMSGATGNIYAGLHEFEDMAFVLHVLRSDDLFVDVGANVGSYTVLAGKVVGARILSFEPIDTTFRHLCDNISLNGLSERVDARRVSVGAKSGIVAMTCHLDTVNHVMAEHDSDPSTLVPQTTLDEALAGRSAFMIKLDVEGYELEVLRGASRTLDDPALQCLLVEFGHVDQRYGYSDSDMFELLRERGFTLCTYDPMQRRLEVPAVPRGSNAIFVRDHALVQSRLSEARPFRVLNRSI